MGSCRDGKGRSYLIIYGRPYAYSMTIGIYRVFEDTIGIGLNIARK